MAIHLSHERMNQRHHGRWFACRSDDQVQIWRVVLRERVINERLWSVLQHAIFPALHDTGDRQHSALRIAEAMSHHGACEVARGEHVVDDDHRRGQTGITFMEEPPFHQWNAHDLKVACRHLVRVDLDRLGDLGLTGLNADLSLIGLPQRKRSNPSCNGNASEVSEGLHYARLISEPARWISVATRYRHHDDADVSSGGGEVASEHFSEALHEKTRHDNESCGKADLADDQRVAHPRVSARV